MTQDGSSAGRKSRELLIAAAAAFCTYFCMYAFRKPFTAATFDGQQVFGTALKTVLVISQLAGYMLSKFIGIKVVSEALPERRAITIVGLIAVAQTALVGFAFLPLQLKFLMMFLNGLPLGMVFGLVLSFLEGRRHTEALSAALCASFIVSSGVVKSVGRFLVQDVGVSEFVMPAVTGAMFLPPLLLSVWILRRTPRPDLQDRLSRSERNPMSGAQRLQFVRSYWPGLTLMVLTYVALTVARTVRDDFGVEIWRDMGVDEAPSVFALSEVVVAICVTALTAVFIWIRHNLVAIWITGVLMCAALALVAGSAAMQTMELISPFSFMAACGVGLYLPYVAFHTTIFERIVAASKQPGNLVFLMYVADTAGYLGYGTLLAIKTSIPTPDVMLPFFRSTLWIVSAGSILALSGALAYFHFRLRSEQRVEVEGKLTEPSPVPQTS